MVDRLSLQFATANNNDCNQAVLSGVLCIWLCYVVCKLRIQKVVSLASMFLPGYYLALSFVHFSCHLCTQDNRDHLHYLLHNLCHHSLLRHHRSPPMTAKTKTKRRHNLTLTSNPNPTHSDYFMLQHSSHVKAQHGIWYNNTFGTMIRILLSCIPLVWYSFHPDPIKKSGLTFFFVFSALRGPLPFSFSSKTT